MPYLKQIHKGYSSVLGAIIINLILGSFYLWGTLNLYVASYYHAIDSTFTLEQSVIIFPLLSFSFHVSAPVSLKIVDKIGFRPHLSLGLFLICFSLFFSLYFNTFWGFLIIYGISFGFLIGFTYLVPLFNCYKYFPENKRGLITGLISGAYGFASFLSISFLISFLNPANESPLRSSFDNNYYFSQKICKNLPSSLRYLAGFYLILGIIGVLLSFKYQSNEENTNLLVNLSQNSENNKKVLEDDPLKITNEDPKFSIKEEKITINKAKISNYELKIKPSESPSKESTHIFSSINAPLEEVIIQCEYLSQAFKSSLFYYLLIFLMLSTSNGFFMAANYKNLGILSISDDNFLNMIGSFGALTNGFGRIIWGILLDKYQFKASYILLLSLQFIEGISLKFIIEYQWIYLIWVGVSFFCLGGHLVLFPTFCVRCFGLKVGPQAYGFICWGLFLGNALQTLAVIGLKNVIGFENVGFLLSGLSLICLGMASVVMLKF